jgi:DNA polymerase-3 subunit delta'
MSNGPLPWQGELWRGLQERARQHNLPHALLFTGMAGVGKVALARQFAHSLLCEHPDATGLACGHCQACGLLAAGTHPDLAMVEPEEEGKAIPIDRIREVGTFLGLKAQYGGLQVVVIHPAEAMNRFAANSLLKTLEEPTPETLLILVSDQPSRLLPTIRSRCQQLSFPRPATDLAEAWLREQMGETVDVAVLLALADGAPLAALRLHQEGGLEARQRLAQQWLELATGQGDPLKLAKAWQDWGLRRALQWLTSWTTDLVRLKSGGRPDVISNKDLGPQLQMLAERLDLKPLFGYLDQLSEYNRWAGGQLNAQLVLEDLMIQWRRGPARPVKSSGSRHTT